MPDHAPALAAAAAAYGDVGLRLAIDAVAIAVLAYAIYFRRHRRRDLFVIYALFNVGVFLAVVVICTAQIGLAVGLGLFAVLSIVRLRSEPFANAELAYFFLALVLGLVNGLELGDPAFGAALSAVALLAAGVIDHPRLLSPSRRVDVVLEVVFADSDALRRHLEERLALHVVDIELVEVDYVRETTRVMLRGIDREQGAAIASEDLDARVAPLER